MSKNWFNKAIINTNKYSATKVNRAGRSFASKLEAAVFDYLKSREADGEIKDIRCQESVYLTLARIQYIADFSYFDLSLNEKVFAEAKGMETDVFRIKRRLWMWYGSDRLLIYKGRHTNIVLHETIIPKITNGQTQLETRAL